MAGSRDFLSLETFVVSDVTDEELTLMETGQLDDEPAGAEVTIQVGSVAAAFWLFTCICFLSFLFGITIMPETKGRTLEDIGASWRES